MLMWQLHGSLCSECFARLLAAGNAERRVTVGFSLGRVKRKIQNNKEDFRHFAYSFHKTMDGAHRV